MKLISRMLSRFHTKASHSIFGAAVVLLVTLLLLFSRFILNKEERVKAALQSGQRIEVSVETSAVISENPEQEKLKAQNATVIQATQPPEKPIDDSVASVSIKDISVKPVVIIIIKELGLNPSFTHEALSLPKEITMGFSPYSARLGELVSESKALGHESILNIPMEVKDEHVDNPGEYTLLTKNSDAGNIKILEKLLGIAKDFDAVYSDADEVFTKSANRLQPVLEVLKQESKHFIYGGGYENYSTIQASGIVNDPILVNDLALDDDVSSDAINTQFVAMEKIANEKGYVVATAHAYPITINILKTWLEKAPEKGFVVSPASLLLGKTIK